MSDAMAFVRAQTALATPALVPEIRLHLASDVTPLWHATEATLAERGLPPPYWAFAWPGGLALARHVLDHPDLARGRRVLDFASGSGIAGIAAAKATAAGVAAAEIDGFAAAAIALNAAINGVTIEIITMDLIDGADRTMIAWDLVLAGDVCYEQPMAGRAIDWLRRLARAGATVLLADPGRSYRPLGGIAEVARYCVPTSRAIEGRNEIETVVWRLLAH